MKRPEKYMRIVGYSSLGLLGLLACLVLNPSAKDNSFATCLDGMGDGECAVSALSQEVGVTTKTAITLATANQVKLPDVTPTSSGVTSYASTKLAVSTNSKEGYSIFLQTGTADGNLVGVTSGMDSVGQISNTTKNGATLSNLETDSYGYALSTTAVNDNTTYSHVPTSSTAIYSKTSNAAMGDGGADYPYGDEYYLAFGTKIGTTLPAGTYSGTVTVSAVANPITVTSLYDISRMQEMTSSICENTREGYTKQLIDSRDGKAYWVAKLRDGNCWMTQNLALDLSTEVALTPEDSDVSSPWTPTFNTEREIPEPLAGDGEVTDTRSWNLGMVVLVKSKGEESCKGILTGDDIIDCKLFMSVRNMSSNFKATTETNIDLDALTYDAHYLVGNYYQWSTATAGTGIGLVGTPATNAEGAGFTNASSSICPKGWMLPKAGRNTSSTETFFGVGPGQSYSIDGSFYGLLDKYGYTTGWQINSGNGYMAIVSSNRTARLDYVPMYFVRAGRIIINKGMLGYSGDNGFVWSSTATVDTGWGADYLQYNKNNVFPSYGDSRRSGFSVRCLAK